MGTAASVFTVVLVLIALIGLGMGTWITIAGGHAGDSKGEAALGLLGGSLVGWPYFAVGVIALAGATIAIAVDAASHHAAEGTEAIIRAIAELRGIERDTADAPGATADAA